MALKIILKPNERMIVGGAVVRNGNAKTELFVENNIPLLREKDILSEAEADTPCKRIYFAIQLMYVDGENLSEHQVVYWELVKELVRAAPSTIVYVDEISENIVSGRYYQALKTAQRLIEYETEVTSNVHSTAGDLQKRAEDHHVRP